jgi:predicted acyl esterase
MFGIANPYLSGIVNVVTVFGGLTTAALMMLYVNQNKLLYMPYPPGMPRTPDDNPDGWKSPREWNTRGKPKRFHADSEDVILEDTMVETFDGVKLHTWLIMHKNAERYPTLVILHIVHIVFLTNNNTRRFTFMGMQGIWDLGALLT